MYTSQMNRPADLFFYFESYAEIAQHLVTITNEIARLMPDHPYSIAIDADDDSTKLCFWVRFEGIDAGDFVSFAYKFYDILPGIYDGWGIDYSRDPHILTSESTDDEHSPADDGAPDDLTASWCIPEI